MIEKETEHGNYIGRKDIILDFPGLILIFGLMLDSEKGLIN